MKPRSVTHASFTLKRNFRQPPARVFAAFATETNKQAWFHGPDEWGRDKHELDFRVGGRETSVGGPPGGPVSSFRGIYQDIVPDERIVYSYDMDLDGERISVSLATIELKPEGGGTHLTLTEQGAYLDGWDHPEGREQGTRDLLDNLERYLNQN
ncbi:MAG: SRPBCC family protein [Devosia sp.]|jgi:uncharacterized protein YndB with AHSA1/START domain